MAAIVCWESLQPTFTQVLLRKDFDLGLESAEQLGVELAERCRELVQRVIDDGYVDTDFAAMIAVQAREAGMELTPEDVDVPDGLEPKESLPVRA